MTGLNLDEMLARVTTLNATNTTQARTYLTDALGSVIAQTQDNQSTLAGYSYSPYGQTQSTGNTEGDSVQYTGRENDHNGLYYYRARYYDPVLKRFLSEDPIGLAGGSLSFYSYVNGNPVSYADPLGLMGSSSPGSNRGRTNYHPGTGPGIGPGQILNNIGNGLYNKIRDFDKKGQNWWDKNSQPPYDTKHCATPECRMGLLPTPNDLRTKEQHEIAQCEFTCGLLGPGEMIPDSLTCWGIIEWGLKNPGTNTACNWICKDPIRRKTFNGR